MACLGLLLVAPHLRPFVAPSLLNFSFNYVTHIMVMVSESMQCGSVGGEAWCIKQRLDFEIVSLRITSLIFVCKA